jgi:hypothetical protein
MVSRKASIHKLKEKLKNDKYNQRNLDLKYSTAEDS